MVQEPQHEARAAIRPVKERVEDELIARPGVVGVDIDEKETGGEKTGELSIVVYVAQKKPKGELTEAEQVPAEINGVKTDVQELTIELQQSKVLVEGAALVDASAYPTLVGGISMGPVRSVYLTPPEVPTAGNYVFVGTLGAMVRDRATGATMAMTNFHVACINSGWSVGDRMVQPSLVDGGSAATQQFGSLTRAVLSENVDGAVVTVDAGKAWDYSVQAIGDVAGSTPAVTGVAVQKRGRTTEHTFGSVASTDFTVSIDYGDGLGTRTLRHQIRIATDTTRSARFSDHGDSGSVVMDEHRNVVGLLFAGSNDGSMTFANPIQAALDELGVDLLVRPVIRHSRPVVTCLTTRLDPLCPTRVVVQCLPTRLTLCTTRTVICDIRTRPVICDIRTRPVICDIQVSRPVCEFVTRAGCPEEIDPRSPIEIPGQMSAGSGSFGSQYSTGDLDLDATYLAGYLAAIEDISAEDERDAEQGQA